MIDNDLHYLAYSALLAWVMIMAAVQLRLRGWTPKGMALSLSNRQNIPEATPLAGRAERAARNMLENFLLFAALLLGAHAAGVSGARLELGAQIFFFARLAYFPIYLAGTPYLRTVAWTVSVVGMAMILVKLF